MKKIILLLTMLIISTSCLFGCNNSTNDFYKYEGNLTPINRQNQDSSNEYEKIEENVVEDSIKSHSNTEIIEKEYSSINIIEPKDIDTIEELAEAVKSEENIELIKTYTTTLVDNEIQTIDIKSKISNEEITWRVVYTGDLISYGVNKKGCILQLMSVYNEGIQWNITKDSSCYCNSNINMWLNNEFAQLCDSSFTKYLQKGYCQVAHGTQANAMEICNTNFSKFFLPSVTELNANNNLFALEEGLSWDYWKLVCEKANQSSSATYKKVSGRILPIMETSIYYSSIYWTRSPLTTPYNYNLPKSAYVMCGGGPSSAINTNNIGYGVSPACLIY